MKKHIVFLLVFLLGIVSFSVQSQTLIINEVSNGPTGSQEYVEFVVVDSTVVYDCNGGPPPCVDIRGWIYDDNTGYHGTSGIAQGAARFSMDPLWSCVPVGTIIVLYNGVDPNPDVPADDVSLTDGNCVISVSLDNLQFFEFTESTPGDIACNYPTTGWGLDPSPNWANVAMANGGDCARLVDLNGCEVFSLCYGAANLNSMIYFSSGGSGTDNNWSFGGGDPYIQGNWSEGCAGDINACGANDQTPGAPNNPANAAYIGQFNNNCSPIPPMVVTSAFVDAGCGCTGIASITATGSIPGYTYEWYDISWATIGQTNDTATNLCAGTYYGIATASIGCEDTVTVTISSPLAMTSSNINSNPLCFGSCDGTATITVLGGILPYTYAWNNSASTTNSAADLCTGFHSVLITDAIGCFVTDTFTLFEPPIITATTVGVDPLCFGGTDGSVSLTVNGGTPGYTYLWDDALTSTTQNISNLPAGTFNVIITDINNCTQTDQIVISEPSALILSTVSDSTTCNLVCDGFITASTTGGTGPYQYSTDNVTYGLGTFNNLCEGIYSVYTTDSQGCLDSVSVEIFIVGPPADATIGPVVTLCENIAPIQLFAADPGGVWSGNGITNSSIGIFDPATAGAGTHIVTYLIAGACGDTATVTVDVLPADNIIITPPLDICEDDSNIFESVQSTGGVWSGTGIVNNTTGEFSPTISGVGSFTIYYTTNGTCSDIDSIIQVVLPIDIPIINVVNAMCLNDASIVLSADIPGGTWSGIGITDSINGTFDPTIAGAGNHIITYNLNTQCAGNDAIIIVVNDAPQGDIILGNSTGCTPLTVTFTNPLAGANQTCIWDLGNGEQSTNCSSFNSTYTTEGCFDVSLTITDQIGCVSTVTATSQVCTNPSPTAGFSYTPSTPNEYDAYVELLNESTNSISYEWFVNGSINSTDEYSFYDFEDIGVGTYPVCLVALNSSGCTDTLCQDIIIEADFSIYVPNAFSPNGNGDNDLFGAVINGPVPEEFELLIFNRWGMLIFESDDYLTFWDGNYRGMQSQQDVYVWRIKYKFSGSAKIENLIGHVSLLR